MLMDPSPQSLSAKHMATLLRKKAICYLRLQHHELAIDSATKAKVISPTESINLLLMFMIFIDQGLSEEAIKVLEEVEDFADWDLGMATEVADLAFKVCDLEDFSANF